MYGVNSANNIFCRTGITVANPKGTNWRLIPGALKYVSCGGFGCCGVNNQDNIFFRTGVTAAKYDGLSWIPVPGKLMQLEVRAF